MVPAATHVENNMGSKVEVTSSSKDKEKKTCFRCISIMIDYTPADKSQMTFMGLDIEADKPRMNVELRVMMDGTVTKIKLN